MSFFAVYAQLAGFNNDAEDGAEALSILASDDDANELKDVALTAGAPYIGRILVIMLYVFCDLAYLLWICFYRSRMGQAERAYILKALIGRGDNMKTAFGYNSDAKGMQKTSSGVQRHNELPKPNRSGKKAP